jgi:hypothetical protein
MSFHPVNEHFTEIGRIILCVADASRNVTKSGKIRLEESKKIAKEKSENSDEGDEGGLGGHYPLGHLRGGGSISALRVTGDPAR